ncbi:hypothetical protein DPMN_134776 [Dreissena polymorpha]|uniref:Mitochondria-eating protein C-terminal domain-containing protein n=1 Tax=Dreissena polymorpha TaxID=45954 RepID=A0A9D4FWT1_DREPO|nr:hypothetical protein DPMN_134776 [Dreissena polymorpha]
MMGSYRPISTDEHNTVEIGDDLIRTETLWTKLKRMTLCICISCRVWWVEGLEEEISDLRKHNDDLEREMLDKNETIEDLTRRLEIEIQARKDDAWQYTQNTSKLMDDLIRVETEKQDALSRLSALMSVKLRDNNPNIADLSDQFRPTKLAEMFSELYDNEWTDAFTVINTGLSERQTITFLLDIIMGAYAFCIRELDGTWSIVSQYYLDPSLPNEQEIQKLLKDSRKVAVVKMTDRISQRYRAHIQSICAVPRLLDMLSSEAFGQYVTHCVNICLLMCANDPPVVITYQDAVESINSTQSVEISVNKDKAINVDITNKDAKQIGRKQTMEGNEIGEDEMTGKEFQNNLDESYNEEQSHCVENMNPENTLDPRGEPYRDGLDTIEELREIGRFSVVHEHFQRRSFDRNVFKEYTRRGAFIDFVVWPVMYLHQGGPMLGKGVAQGTRKAVYSGQKQWTWKETE